jgi:hypothetical protein
LRPSGAGVAVRPDLNNVSMKSLKLISASRPQGRLTLTPSLRLVLSDVVARTSALRHNIKLASFVLLSTYIAIVI